MEYDYYGPPSNPSENDPTSPMEYTPPITSENEPNSPTQPEKSTKKPQSPKMPHDISSPSPGNNENPGKKPTNPPKDNLPKSDYILLPPICHTVYGQYLDVGVCNYGSCPQMGLFDKLCFGTTAAESVNLNCQGNTFLT